VEVNGKNCPLPDPIPGVQTPGNITALVLLQCNVENNIRMTWKTPFEDKYAVAVYLVKKLTHSDLFESLKTQGVRDASFTRDLIKEKLSDDPVSDIGIISFIMSLMCPLSQMRMTTPCCASTCCHVQCFDASAYLQMNDKKPKWICPVCGKPALYDNLVIDGYLQQVLLSNQLPVDGNKIELHKDGSWSSLIAKQDQTTALSPTVSILYLHICSLW
jgi:hypothetical protein